MFKQYAVVERHGELFIVAYHTYDAAIEFSDDYATAFPNDVVAVIEMDIEISEMHVKPNSSLVMYR